MANEESPIEVTIDTFRGKTVRIFEKEGVRVEIPAETYPDKYNPKISRKLFIGQKKLHYHDPNADFRWVINFYIYYIDDDGKEEIVENLRKCPMTFWVAHDLEKDKGKTELYWLNPRNGEPEPIGAFTREKLSNEIDGYARVDCDFWGDPNIGW